MSILPVPGQEAADLAWWGTAWLRGVVPADDLLDHWAEDGRPAHACWEGAPDEATEAPLLELLARWRRAGATRIGLALPAPGDPLGLGGPPGFNAEALAQGQAVVTDVGEGAVPLVGPETVTWQARPAAARPLPDVGEADRGLREAIRSTTSRLLQLDVARWHPDVAELLTDLHDPPTVEAVPGVPPRCLHLALRARTVFAVVEVALDNQGGAVTAHEVGLRAEALGSLEHAARRAMVAACSPEAWPEPTS